jgi:pyruvate-formate lyase-activating enzyme
MKKIQFTKGCPNGCEYCYEPTEIEYLYPDIPKNKECVQILDMNFLCNPNAKSFLNALIGQNKSYELVCGIDYRRIDIETASLMKKAKFIKIRWAWDYNFGQQKIHKKIKDMFLKVGYKPNDLSVFIIVNWKIPYIDCVKKLDLLKVWNVKVNDCCYDGGYRLAKAKYWTPEQIKRFRKMCRKHNQIVNFGIDPEFK